MIVKKAEYVNDHKIKLLFSDGVTKVVDFTPYLTSTRKVVAPLLDAEYFKQFYVDEVTICWPNGLDFAPELLYKIGKNFQEKKKTPKLVARRKHVNIPVHTMAKKRSKKAKR
jgi:hypothetical protein